MFAFLLFALQCTTYLKNVLGDFDACGKSKSVGNSKRISFVYPLSAKICKFNILCKKLLNTYQETQIHR